MTDFVNGKLGLCGINFISSTQALTAAHCLDNTEKLYPNTGEYS